MLIQIKAKEKGWDTLRQIELPDDDKLLRALLRTVKRYENSGGGVTENCDTPAELAADPEPAPVPDPEPDPAAGRTVFEHGFRGFLLIRCPGCGKEYSVNAREPIQSSMCRSCGRETALEELAVAEFTCPDCGRAWRYRTNSEEPDVTTRCIKCGAQMVSEWNSKLRRYMPHK